MFNFFEFNKFSELIKVVTINSFGIGFKYLNTTISYFNNSTSGRLY